MAIDEIEDNVKSFKIKNKEFTLQHPEDVKKPCLIVTMDSALSFLKEPIGLELYVNYDLPFTLVPFICYLYIRYVI